MGRFVGAASVLVLLVWLSAVFAGAAYARTGPDIPLGPGRIFYIDPGTASIILQVLVGAVIGGLVSIRLFWSRINGSIKRFFSKRDHEPKKD
jgi:hypothetical protein